VQAIIQYIVASSIDVVKLLSALLIVCTSPLALTETCCTNVQITRWQKKQF